MGAREVLDGCDVVVDQEAAVPGRVKLVESVHHRRDYASGGVDEAVVPAAPAEAAKFAANRS